MAEKELVFNEVEFTPKPVGWLTLMQVVLGICAVVVILAIFGLDPTDIVTAVVTVIGEVVLQQLKSLKILQEIQLSPKTIAKLKNLSEDELDKLLKKVLPGDTHTEARRSIRNLIDRRINWP